MNAGSVHHITPKTIAELAVKTTKYYLEGKREQEDAFLAVVAFRKTISQEVSHSPAQRMLQNYPIGIEGVAFQRNLELMEFLEFQESDPIRTVGGVAI